MDRDHLCQSLLTWMHTFSVETTFKTAEDVIDGVVMSEILNQIAPEFFNEAWMAKVKKESGGNWRLKVSNLKKILKGILEYYQEVLGQQISDFHMPDVNAIGEKCDHSELGRLIQLILGCAVNCDDKQDYIQRIMSMEEEVQHVVMNAIQELMSKESPAGFGEGSSEIGDQLKRTIAELNSVISQKEETEQRCHELDLQVSALVEEKTMLFDENERLRDSQQNQNDSLDDPSTPAGRRYHQLQIQVENQQEELFRMEAARDDYRIKVELQEKEILDLQQKNDELNSLAEEARALKDEVDILRHTADKVAKYESTIETYKKRLEELSDLRGQIKIMEEKNTNYMQKQLELEEELRKGGNVKSSLDLYKRQVQELQMKAGDETKRADKAVFEAKRLQEKLQSLQRDKERLAAERDSLKETNEELTLNQLNQGELAASPLGESAGSLELMNVPPEIREKIIRLTHENKMLKLSREGSDDENVQMLRNMLDDTETRKQELETENRICNQRILELEATVEDIQESQTSQSDDSADLRKKLNEHIQKNRDLDTDLQRKKSHIEELEPRISSYNDKINTLQDALSKKEDEMKAMEERYKKYLEKAKSVIKALDSKQNPGNAPEIQALKNQLAEKDKLIEHLEKDHDKAKAVREQEEKLVVTAWYNLGMQLHRKAAEERLTNSGAGQSFLARQRQAHTRRTPSVAMGHPTASR
ncbi:unnamed protein product [Owenia fusiformis]|uniref:Uncharacterized protein n=1 Tax=Owenia fusiformis TaxID=6347 RepID=A0A8J1XZP2_OWEFU|nr:unnamed protein product [Owenia fusiformis]